ncbi:MAG: YdeI/OmpD-associated family protein [Ferruginibacter sp.]
MKISFTAALKKFVSHGEKTGWTYIEIPKKVTEQLLPGNKKSFRVKGVIDQHTISRVALVPMGEGNFIMAVNAGMRKAIRKQKGASVHLEIEIDKSVLKISPTFITCLNDEPAAMEQFNKMPMSHRQYYSNWIESAKTDATKTKRIALAINTLAQKMNYGEMLRSQKNKE